MSVDTSDRELSFEPPEPPPTQTVEGGEPGFFSCSVSTAGPVEYGKPVARPETMSSWLASVGAGDVHPTGPPPPRKNKRDEAQQQFRDWKEWLDEEPEPE